MSHHEDFSHTRGRYSAHYLVHTPFTRRPYYTNIPFIAADFKRWGFPVDSYPTGSLWIQEQFKKRQRVRPILLWAREVVRHDGEHRIEEDGEQGNEAEVNSLLRDFVTGLVRFDSPSYHYPKSLAYSERAIDLGYPIPPSTPNVLTFYMSLLGPLKVKLNAPGPCMALDPPERLICMTLQFAPHKHRRTQLLQDAMKFAVEARPGRMGELRDRTPLVDMNEHGFMFVNLWVRAQGNDDEGEAREQLPVYMSEEEGAEGELPPSYDEVVVREPVETSHFPQHGNCT